MTEGSLRACGRVRIRTDPLFSEGALELPAQVPRNLEKLDSHPEEKRALLVDPVVPHDPSVQGNALAAVRDPDFKQALLGCNRIGMKDVQAVGKDGVREQRHALVGIVVQSSGKRRGGDLRAGGKIDPKRDGKVQSGSRRPSSFSFEPILHRLPDSCRAVARPDRSPCAELRRISKKSEDSWGFLTSS